MPVGGRDNFPFRNRPNAELLRAWLARSHTVDGIAGAAEFMFSVQPDGTVGTLTGASVTSNFLSVLGVRPELGRTFRREEELAKSPTVAMISHAMWQRAYGEARHRLAGSRHLRDHHARGVVRARRALRIKPTEALRAD